MIRYDEPLYRPPSEAQSLILQATLGCSHNRCAFCVSYQTKKFRVRPEAELFAEIDWIAKRGLPPARVFLADGDAFAMGPERLIRLVRRLYERLPGLERVTAYAGPGNFAHKTDLELQEIRAAGLTMLYFGLESGDDEVLRRIDKGATADLMVQACARATAAGFDLSVTVILGLAGPAGSERHAEQTARALDRIRPRYASALTLMLPPRTPSFAECIGDPAFRSLNPAESLRECRMLLACMQGVGITFRSNHASNYLPLRGELQRDRARLLALIDQALSDPRSPYLRPEWLRAL